MEIYTLHDDTRLSELVFYDNGAGMLEAQTSCDKELITILIKKKSAVKTNRVEKKIIE